MGENRNSDRFYFLQLQNHCGQWLQPWNLLTLAPWKQNCNKPRQHIKKQKHCFDNKGLSGQSYGFSNSHVWMWELDHKEDWEPMNWCFWIVVLEKPHESPLDSKIKPINLIGNQPWKFSERTDAKAEAIILWSPDAESWLIWERPWCWERLRARGEGRNRGWDGWMALLTQWTWVWANSGRQWRTGKPGVLQSMGSQRVRHGLVTEKQQCAFLFSFSVFSDCKYSYPKHLPQSFVSTLSFHFSWVND